MAVLGVPLLVRIAVGGDRYRGPHIYGNYVVLGSRRFSALDGGFEQLCLGWCKNQRQLRCRQDILKPRQLSTAKDLLLDAGTLTEPAMNAKTRISAVIQSKILDPRHGGGLVD